MHVVCPACSERHPPTATFGCANCGGPLAVTYEAPLDRERIETGRTLFEKYGNRLPSNGSAMGIEGGTPLIRADGLAAALDVEATLYLKDERRNPTGSFKDRALGPTVSLAAESGETAVVTASSGNAAAACAHYAARAGLDCYLLVEETVPAGKLTEPRAYGAEVVRVTDLFEGGEAALGDLLGDLAETLDAHLAFAYEPFNPVVGEGVKTVSYEVTEQLVWTAPDVVVTATGGGDNLAAQHRGYVELIEAGLVDQVPRMVAAQAAGAAPVTEAIDRDLDVPPFVEHPDTLASGISAPFAGAHALDAIRESGGTAVAVSDEALVEGAALMARTTAVWPEPSSATVVPVVAELAARGDLDPDDVVVLTVTGSGHKHVEPFEATLADVPTVARDPVAVAAALGRD